jgi:hypothetical protein
LTQKPTERVLRCPTCKGKLTELTSPTSWNALIMLLILVACLARFLGLETSPPGFYVDEAAHAMNAICIQQTGHDGYGVFMPIFAGAIEGGVTPPTLLYTEALWSSIFGTSSASFRSMAAVFNVLTLLGLFLLVTMLFDAQAGLFVALAGAVSPWSFQFSRIAWDPPLAPCFLIFGVYFFLKSDRQVDACMSGVFFALAMYAYAPQRAQVPLLIVLLLPLKRYLGRLILSWCLVVVLTMTVLLGPLAYGILFGPLQARFQAVSVFNATPSWANGLALFGENFFRHFGANFLFLAGDANRRHSSGFVGQWDWLDVGALIGGCCYVLVSIVGGRRLRLGRLEAVVLFSGLAYLAGVVPAALTNEGIPHALRSIGCWPFLALLVGLTLWRLGRIFVHAVPLALAIAAVFFVAYSWDYFVDYPLRAGNWFDVHVQQYAEVTRLRGDWGHFKDSFPAQFDLPRRYFSVRYGGRSCESSR